MQFVKIPDHSRKSMVLCPQVFKIGFCLVQCTATHNDTIPFVWHVGTSVALSLIAGDCEYHYTFYWPWAMRIMVASGAHLEQCSNVIIITIQLILQHYKAG